MADPQSTAVADLTATPGPDPGPSVFVSYASRDRPRALRLVRALKAASVDSWIDVIGITGGHGYGPEIVAGIRGCSALLLLCSAASLTSRNVRQEIQLAWRFGRPILPLRLEPVEFPDTLAYWLEGAQWIDVLDRPPTRWLRQVLRALSRFGAEPRGPGAPGPEQSAQAPAATLPVPPTAILGRTRELADLRRRLEDGARLLTLTGPGGTGKTRLALEAAHGIASEFAHGAVFVDLAPVADPGMVLPAIAQALGLRETGEQPLAEQLRAFLQPRRLLLVLDNFEQVATAAPDIAALLAAAPDLVIIVTSRAPLRVRGEQEVAVGPLALPETGEVPGHGVSPEVALAAVATSPAVLLFLDRARAAGSDVTLTTANVRTVTEIVRRLDGLPLAIELAAARTRLLPPEALLTRLERRLPLLTGGAVDLPVRQQTLRGTISWSHDLLSSADQTLLRRLAVFAAGCSFEGVEAVAAPAAEIDLYEGLASLVRQSLLRQERAAGEPRFTMLETIREFALERLEASGEADEVRRRHARFYLELAERVEPTEHSPPDIARLSCLEAEHDNLRAALAWALPDDVPLALRLGGSLVWFWELRGHLSEGRSWLERALALGGEVPPSLRANALLAAGDLAEIQQDFGAATAALAEALELWRSLGDRRGAARTLRSLGHVAVDQRKYEPAIDRYTESLALWHELGDERGAAIVLVGLGTVAFYQGAYERASELWTDAAAHFRAISDKRRLGTILNNLGSLAWENGKLDQAARIHEEALALGRELGDQTGIAASLTNLGATAQLQGDLERSRAFLEEGLQRYRDLSIPGAIAAPLYFLAWLAREQDEAPLAAARAGEALTASHVTRGALWVGHALELVAALAADQGLAEQGARLLGMVAVLRETTGLAEGASERVYCDRVIEAFRGRLSEDTVRVQMAAGRAIGLDEAVAEATALAANLATGGNGRPRDPSSSP
ncbi:MAG: tetratricopeptide repeat protein [Chloroflexota bacterium]|nr:tetratricopeptide repeat protein [Chloroflexota bacterium]